MGFCFCRDQSLPASWSFTVTTADGGTGQAHPCLTCCDGPVNSTRSFPTLELQQRGNGHPSRTLRLGRNTVRKHRLWFRRAQGPGPASAMHVTCLEGGSGVGPTGRLRRAPGPQAALLGQSRDPLTGLSCPPPAQCGHPPRLRLKPVPPDLSVFQSPGSRARPRLAWLPSVPTSSQCQALPGAHAEPRDEMLCSR